MARRGSSITSRSQGSPVCNRPLKAATDLPVVVGFGVRTPEQAAAIARVADGVVVGSAIVELVGEHGGEAPEMVREYVATLAEAVHGARPPRCD